jgi:hypothetical protein
MKRGFAVPVLVLGLFACSSSATDSTAGGTSSGGDASGSSGDPGGGGSSGSGGANDAGASSSGGGGNDAGQGASTTTSGPIAEQNTFTTLYAVSDLHGHYAELGALLVKYGLAASAPTDPTKIAWTGGNATLVVVGDMIDKGPASLEIVEAVIALQASAPSTGGTVLALLGNHEAEFLGDPTSSKFTGTDRIDGELAAQSPAIDPTAFASGSDPRGAWMRALPCGARVGSWFFSHAGDTGGATIASLDATLSAALASSQAWNSSAITGTNSLLESKTWYSASVVAKNETALGVKHIAFGHDPNAFNSTGQMLAPSAYQGALVKLDTGLGAGYSSGAFLRVRHDGASDVAEALLPDGTVQALWSGAP